MLSKSLKNMSIEDKLKRLPYSLLVVGLHHKGRNIGCTVAWSTQVSYSPIRFMISIGKSRLTGEALLEAAIGAKVSLNYLHYKSKGCAELFGRNSGRDISKWDGVPHSNLYSAPTLIEDIALVMVGPIIAKHDMGSHLGVVIEPYVYEMTDPGEVLLYEGKL